MKLTNQIIDLFEYNPSDVLTWNSRQEEFVQYEAFGNYTEITPLEFLELTLPSEEYSSFLNDSTMFGNHVDTFKMQSNYIIAPYLRIDKKGKVLAHEGRHRMAKFVSDNYLKNREKTVKVAIIVDSKDTDYFWLMPNGDKIPGAYVPSNPPEGNIGRVKDIKFDISKVRYLRGQYENISVPAKIKQDKELMARI
jgi:hypothetical protein